MTDNHDKERKEVDANDIIRDYVESDDAPSPNAQSDTQPQEVPWQDQARQDTQEPAGAVLSGGDIDAAWNQAASGEETVGGSSPTPDQDIVEEIGEALGVIYREGEPLHTTEKIEQRDIERWELNPASSEDFAERNTSLEEKPASSQRKAPSKRATPRTKRTKKKAA